MLLRTDSAAQASIDSEIARHEKILISLKTRRNALAAICQLPHDVISYLLLEIKQLSDREEWTWLKMQGLCRSWRDVAMKTPQLWSSISISEHPGRVSLAEAMLERTSSHPLYVTVSPPYKNLHHLSSLDAPFWAVTERILSQMGRMAAFTFKDRSSEPSSLRKTLQNIPEGSIASQLRILNIDANWKVLVNPQAIPLLFDVGMPSLQNLRLAGVRCLKNFPTLPTLQELSIYQCLASLKDAPVEEIVAVLLHVVKSTPNLKSLNLALLHTPLALQPTSANYTFSTVTLPLLESLNLSRCHSSYQLLLGHLDLPIATHVDLNLSHYEGHPPSSLSHLCHLISRNPSFTDPAVPIHVSMKFPGNLKVTSPDIPACLSVDLPEPTQSSWQYYIRLFTLHAPATTYVSLSSECQYALHLGEVIRPYHQLEVLSFKFSSREWLLHDALKSLLKHPEDAMPPCPCLETIEFRVHLEEDAIPVLESVLQERVQFGVPIKRIRVFQDTKVRWWEDAMFHFSDLIEFMER